MEPSTHEGAPWQFHWKNPVWTQSDAVGETISSRVGDVQSNNGKQVDLAAAAVSLDELNLSGLMASVDEASREKNQPDGDGGGAVLVAGLKTSGNIGKADLVDLEVLSASGRVLKQKTLRWPKSALVKGSFLVGVSFCRKPANTADHPGIEAEVVLEMMSFGMSGPQPSPDSTLRHSKTSRDEPPVHGNTGDLMVVCLTSDARLHFYSASNLVGDAKSRVADKTPTSAVRSPGQRRGGPKKDDGDDLSDAFASLMLGESLHTRIIHEILPLSSPESTVHLGLDIDKLHAFQEVPMKAGTAKPGTTEEENRASGGPRGFLGLPFLKGPNNNNNNNNKLKSVEEHGDGSGSVAGQNRKQKDPDVASRFSQSSAAQSMKDFMQRFEPQVDEANIAIWEHSGWDVTVERSSMRFRTLRNRVVGLKEMFGFVVVWGEGSRIRDVVPPLQEENQDGRQAKIDEEGTGEQKVPDWAVDSTEAVESKTDDGKEIADWWEDGPEDAEATTKTVANVDVEKPNANVDDLSTNGHDADLTSQPEKPFSTKPMKRRTVEAGGFVDFVSLNSMSETKKIYFPFVPRAVHSVVWGGAAFVVVLGNEGFGNTPYATAIRMGTSRLALPETSPSIGQRNSVGQTVNRNDDETKIVPGVTDADGNRDIAKIAHHRDSIRRFQQIPIVIPADDHVLATGVKTFSVVESTPPSVTVVYTQMDNLDADKFEIGLCRSFMDTIDFVDADTFSIHPRYRKVGDQSKTPAIIMKQADGQRAELPFHVSSDDAAKAVGLDGQVSISSCLTRCALFRSAMCLPTHPFCADSRSTNRSR